METTNVTLINSVDSLFAGYLLAALCFGVLAIWTPSYYHVFPNDPRQVGLYGEQCPKCTENGERGSDFIHDIFPNKKEPKEVDLKLHRRLEPS